MTDREKMEEVVRLDGRCEKCSKSIWGCKDCPIKNKCIDGSIQTYGKSSRLAREWLIENDKKEHGMKFKVGDKVRVNLRALTDIYVGLHELAKSNNNIHVITGIEYNKYLIDSDKEWCFLETDLELITDEWQPVKGKRYEVAHSESFQGSYERIFYNKEEGFESSYNCIDGLYEGEYRDKKYIKLDNYKYIREIQPKYKAYIEFDPKWIGEEVNCEFFGKKRIGTIVGKAFGGCVVVKIDDWCINISLSNLLIKSSWTKDNKPFGEEISCKN